MKDLAVLIAVYNDEEALLKALDSIDEPDNSFTVVVVDGGSSKPPVIDRGRYPFEIVLIQQEQNEGLASGLNVGIDYIRNHGFKYLARFDAGDLARPHRLAIQYRRFQESGELVLLGTNAVFVDQSTGRSLFETNLPHTWEEIKKWCVFRTCFIHPTVMLRIDRLDASFRYDPKYHHIEDYVLFTRIAERHPSEVLVEPLVDCFVREEGISRRSDRAQLITGIRHHLRHPRPARLLWYAYLVKRFAYLLVPYSWRNHPKRWLRFIGEPRLKAAAGNVEIPVFVK